MGCGGSKEVPNFDNNNKGVEVKSTVDHESDDKKQDKIKVKESNSFDSPSPIELVPDVQNDITKSLNLAGDRNVAPRIFQKQVYVSRQEETPSDGDVDGWTTGHVKSLHHKQKNNLININSEMDSEYGKDGIDLTSTSYGVLLSPKKSSRQPSADGIQFEVVPRLTKKDLEEPFDPSTLIDIDKFKAVNAPKEVETTDKYKAVTMDTKHQGKPISNGQALNALPSKYNELYDEDEKALMESIEQDFVETMYTTLPGAVI